MGKLYQYLAVSLLATVAGFFVGLFLIPPSVIAVANVIALVFLIAMLIIALIVRLIQKKKSRQIRFSILLVYLFAFVEGALLYPALMYYLAQLGVLLFAEIVIGTLVVFGILAFIGQKREAGSFVSLGKTLLIILIVMIIVSIVNLFLLLDVVNMLLSAAGVLIFSIYILVDVNRFKTAYRAGQIRESRDYSIYVLNVYIDIINLLLDLLDLVSIFKN